jgi:cell division protein FtsW
MKFSRAERAHVADWWLSIDRTLLVLVLTLAVAGLAASVITSPTVGIHLTGDPFYFVKRQAIGMAAALATMFAVSLLNPSQMKRLALLLFAGGAILMIAALVQGAERNGATRWLFLAGAVIQPSEFVKPGFIVLTAWLFSESVKRPDMPALELSLLMLAIFLSLLVLQPDIGQAIIAACVWCGILFLAGYSLKLLPVFLLLGAGGLTAAYFTMPHFMTRLNRFTQGAGDSTQISVAVNAFREAGWLGHGLGEGFTKSRLPDAHNDFVFAAIAEETGIAACLFLILIYALIVWRVLRRAFREEDAFVRLAAAGLVMIFGLQALINMAVNLNLLPAKGVTLPLVSYGRSSLIASAITLGMIAGLTRRTGVRLASHTMRDMRELSITPGSRGSQP